MICTAHQYCAGDKIEKNEMGGACGTYGRQKMGIQGFGGGNLRERDNFDDPRIDERKYENVFSGSGM